MPDESLDQQPEQHSSGGATFLAGRLQGLADRGIYLGTSSWKYPGWCGQVYDRSRYQTRGKFSKKKFEQECLREYAGVFPTVCGDFAFYQFPTEEFWRRTFEQLPERYQFSLKVPDEITVERFPDLPRYGPRAGASNGHFMDAGLLREHLLEPLEPYLSKLGVLILQFGTFRDSPMCEPATFASRLSEMFGALPLNRFTFAVEVRNQGFLKSADYFSCLREFGVAHCLNSWTRMPAVAEQMRIQDILTARHVVARFLLRPGRTYEQAVRKFAPYERVREEYPEGRSALRELIDRCLTESHLLYAFVNNRFEGNAVTTIQSAVCR